MNLDLLQPQVRSYLLQHIHDNAASFILRTHPFKIKTKVLTQQLIGLQKARHKFPILFKEKQALYPPKVNLEQTSSWKTAVYKANLVKGTSIVDLTGGLGIDGIAFAKTYSKTIHIELDKDLQEIASHNFKALELPIESYLNHGIDFLKSSKDHFDLIYIDPSRKTETTSKAILLKDYEPDVTTHQELFFQKSDHVLIKTSPMLDITAGLNQLNHVAQIHIVAVKNEVKELLWLLKKDSTSVKVHAINLNTKQPVFNYVLSKRATITLEQPRHYLYEPNAAIMKSQAFGDICKQFKVSKIDQDAHIFTHDNYIDFPGRCFEILSIQDYKPKVIKRKYGKGAHAVVVRNFRESVKSLRIKFNFSEHETNYLFFTSITGRGYVVIEAVKIKS